MIQAPFHPSTTVQWHTVCDLDQILPNTGVCALIGDRQVAIFRIRPQNQTATSTKDDVDHVDDVVYAIDNYDPFSHAYVLSRGIIGDRQGIPKVASPLYKQNFNLMTGECLDNPAVRVAVFPTQIINGQVQVGTPQP